MRDWAVVAVVALVLVAVGGVIYAAIEQGDRKDILCQRLCGQDGVMVRTAHGDCVCQQRR